MSVFNFDLEDGLPPISFTLKPADAERFMAFMAECQAIKGPTAPATVEDEHALFEAWALEHHYRIDRDGSGYDAYVTDVIWTGWKARAALSTAAVKDQPAPDGYLVIGSSDDGPSPERYVVLRGHAELLAQEWREQGYGVVIEPRWSQPVVAAVKAAEVPEGYVLVPIEPTPAMLSAVDGEAEDKHIARGRAYSAWKSMIAAAPAQGKAGV